MLTRETNATELDWHTRAAWDEVTDLADCRMAAAGYRLWDKDGLELVPLDCGEWKCRTHGPRKAYRWQLRLERHEFSNMLLLTNVPEDRELARKGWTKLLRQLKRRHGVTSYLKVMELGPEHGMRHWHVLVTGTGFIPVRWLSEACRRAGLGRIVFAREIDDIAGAINYVIGYVFKSLAVPDARKKGWRAVTCSRDIPNGPKAQARSFGLVPQEPKEYTLVNVGRGTK